MRELGGAEVRGLLEDGVVPGGLEAGLDGLARLLPERCGIDPRPRAVDEATHLLADGHDVVPGIEVRRAHPAAPEREDAFEALVGLGGVEAGGARRREREAAVRLERGVDEAERIAAVDGVGRRIVHREVVERMAVRVEHAEGGVAEREALPIGQRSHALLWNRRERAVELGEALLAVDGRGAAHQRRRVDEVLGSAWVREHGRVGARGQERAGARGVIEMRVRHDDPAHLLGAHAVLRERGEETRQRMDGMGLDEGALVARDAQVTGGETRLDVGVDREAFVAHGAGFYAIALKATDAGARAARRGCDHGPPACRGCSTRGFSRCARRRRAGRRSRGWHTRRP